MSQDDIKGFTWKIRSHFSASCCKWITDQMLTINWLIYVAQVLFAKIPVPNKLENSKSIWEPVTKKYILTRIKLDFQLNEMMCSVQLYILFDHSTIHAAYKWFWYTHGTALVHWTVDWHSDLPMDSVGVTETVGYAYIRQRGIEARSQSKVYSMLQSPTTVFRRDSVDLHGNIWIAQLR